MQEGQIVFQVMEYSHKLPDGSEAFNIRAMAATLRQAQEAVKQLGLAKYVISCSVVLIREGSANTIISASPGDVIKLTQ